MTEIRCILPERVKRFNIGKVTSSRQKDFNGNSTKEENPKVVIYTDQNEIDQLSYPNTLIIIILTYILIN